MSEASFASGTGVGGFGYLKCRLGPSVAEEGSELGSEGFDEGRLGGSQIVRERGAPENRL